MRYNITLRSVRVTVVEVEKQYLLHILSGCSVPRVIHAWALLLSVAGPAVLGFSTELIFRLLTLQTPN